MEELGIGSWKEQEVKDYTIAEEKIAELAEIKKEKNQRKKKPIKNKTVFEVFCILNYFSLSDGPYVPTCYDQ